MFSRVLIANRGEIAVRIIRACRHLSIGAVVVHSDPDRASLAVALADDAVALDGTSAAATYLDIERVVAAAVSSGCDAIHPGYGFLAENADFASAVTAAGLAWIGPPAPVIALMGDKLAAREVAQRAGVAGVPGTMVVVDDPATVAALGDELGWPLAVKAVHGGGGRGMRPIWHAGEVVAALDTARREARSSFGRDEVYVERFLASPRHVEVQVAADDFGTVVVVGDRDCSIQRRYQKLIEEAPAPGLADVVRQRLATDAARLTTAVGYRNVGTIEFLVERDETFFLEMNTRIQVEHPVTELVSGVDLVAEQIRIAAGEPLSFGPADVTPRGAAIEVRLNAEDTTGGAFLPAPGTLRRFELPGGPGVRVDTGFRVGDEIVPYYDNLIAKIAVWGVDREAARRAALVALGELVVEGTATTASAAAAILAHDDFRDVAHTTHWLTDHAPQLLAAPRTDGELGAESAAAADTHAVAVDERHDVLVLGRWYRIPLLGDGAAVGGEPAAGPVRTGVGRPRPADGRDRTSARRGRGNGKVTAPMQGTVIVVAVAVGDEVAADTTVAVLEAMKMENNLLAGAAGTVRAVLATVGANVAPGALLVEIDVADVAGP